MTNKEIKEKVLTWEYQYGRLLPMIISHYIDKGSTTWSQITVADLESMKNKMQQETEEAEQKGSVMLITPDFAYMLGEACVKLAKEEHNIRVALIKKYIC